jgi:hypothetical protein
MQNLINTAGKQGSSMDILKGKISLFASKIKKEAPPQPSDIKYPTFREKLLEEYMELV